MSEELHPRRLRILHFLARRRGGEPPSVSEVADAAGLRSTQTAHHHLSVLESGGYVERLPAPSSKPSRKRRPVRLTQRGWAAVGEVPALGRISAGFGIEPIREVGETVAVGGFALTAAGDSMTGAGIEDGDRLLFVPDESPPDGAIVAALVGGERVTVKRLFREGGLARLAAENPEHEDIVVDAAEVVVQGRLEWILRRPNGRNGR